ncbi:MAG: hypothetical protein GY871_08410 [Actinomycetales bacterium]|nr:hypothetical protein [Actinomycetales bacterium]
MSKFGLDSRILKQTLEDMTYEMEQMQSNAFSRHGLTEDETATHDAARSLIDRARKHYAEIKGGPETRLLDRIETGTAAMADLSGIASFMAPVTNAVRNMASNQGKAAMLKHLPRLIQLAEKLGEEFTTKEAITAARKLGIPRDLVVYMAHAGLLTRKGKVLRALINHIPEEAARRGAPGRLVDMNEIQKSIDASRQSRREAGLGVGFDAEGKAAQDIEDEVLPALNQFLQFFIGERSPELRGAFRVQGKNPLADLMFSLVTYPMAAYSQLMANGVTAKGVGRLGALTFGLMIMEYINRNSQRAMFSQDPDERDEAIRSLTNPKYTDMIDVVAQYGTSSPLFGQLGSYVKDIAGAPLARMAYDGLDVDAGEREKFWRAQPFSSPAISMTGKFMGTVSGLASAGAGAVFGDDRAKKQFRKKAGDAAELAVDISPFNNLAFEGPLSFFTGGGLADHAKSAFITEQAGARSGLFVPQIDQTVRDAFPAPFTGGASKPAPDLLGQARQATTSAPKQQQSSGGSPASPSEGLADAPELRGKK